jgi:hypothetical protein
MFSGGALTGRSRWIRGGLGLMLGVVLAVFFAVPLEMLPLPVCVLKEVTGVSCLTCGLTRSLQAASHGHIAAALRFHLLGPFLIAGLAVALMTCAVEGVGGKDMGLWGSRRLQKTVLVILVLVWILYGVVRAMVELW